MPMGLITPVCGSPCSTRKTPGGAGHRAGKLRRRHRGECAARHRRHPPHPAQRQGGVTVERSAAGWTSDEPQRCSPFDLRLWKAGGYIRTIICAFRLPRSSPDRCGTCSPTRASAPYRSPLRLPIFSVIRSSSLKATELSGSNVRRRTHHRWCRRRPSRRRFRRRRYRCGLMQRR